MKEIKSHTDIPQSMKLAKILPFESADMFFPENEEDVKRTWELKGKPCWSLAALLDVLPKIHKLKPILDLEENSIQYSGTDIYVKADNPVDACCELILKLHELKML